MLSAGFIGILLVIFKLSPVSGYQTFFLHTSHYTSDFTHKKEEFLEKILEENAKKADEINFGIEEYKKIYVEKVEILEKMQGKLEETQKELRGIAKAFEVRKDGGRA